VRCPPKFPGHEVAGVIDKVGAGVSTWKNGQRVGVGWHGGQDNMCPSCRRGDFRNCSNLKIPGISYDGGYQQYMVAPVEALAAVPPKVPAAADSCKNIRLSADAANPLNRSRNWRADGDGCVGAG
jgi:D-arabinose 1-dehydrogenase-like Zn-dependent alcohol dehydrogenase